ncbi:MAG: hypothetical protein ACP5JP_10050, partial [bacterium]
SLRVGTPSLITQTSLFCKRIFRVNGVTGFLVNSEEGAAFRIRQILNNPNMANKMGENARQYVRNHFLITRQIRDYLFVWYAMLNKSKTVMEL